MSSFTQEGSYFWKKMFVLLLAALASVTAFGESKNKDQLYDGPPRPSDQVVTFNFGSLSIARAEILLGPKWVGLHKGVQILPGTYQIKFSIGCTLGQSGGKYSIPFFASGSDQVQLTVSAGDTVIVWFGKFGKNDHQYGPCFAPSFYLAVVPSASAESAAPSPPPSFLAPVARLADGTIVQPGYVFPVTNKLDIKLLQVAEGAKLDNTTLPSGKYVPAAPGGMSWRVRGGKIVLELDEAQPMPNTEPAAELSPKPSDVSPVTNNTHESDLIDAAGRGDLPRVEALLGAKADVNAKAADGTTALVAAVENEHQDVVRALLDAEAPVADRGANETAPASSALSTAPVSKIVILSLVAPPALRQHVDTEKLRKRAQKILEAKHYTVILSDTPQLSERWVMVLRLDSLDQVTASFSGLIYDTQSGTEVWKAGGAGQFAPAQPGDYHRNANEAMMDDAGTNLGNSFSILFGLSKSEAIDSALDNLMRTVPTLPKNKK